MVTREQPIDGQSRTRSTLPEAFIEQVRTALAHLYDLDYLKQHPLVLQDSRRVRKVSDMSGQQLRQALASAIEQLNPGPAIGFGAPQARPYNLLVLRYIQCMTVTGAANRLGISRRQAQRDLRQGVEGVAALLAANHTATTGQDARETQISTFEAEIARLQPRSEPVDLGVLLERAQGALRSQAAQRDVRLRVVLPREPVAISTNPVVAEQIILNALSAAIQEACPGELHLELSSAKGQACITLCYLPEPGARGAPGLNMVISQLADWLHWTVEARDRSGAERVVSLRPPPLGPTVLVVDDNEGLVELLQRYLTDQVGHVIAASDGQKGLQMVQEIVPDAIVLDVMLPGTHGWEVLQRVRNNPRTAHVPVIVCSVINNPDLAYSLGASLFLPKPISREGLLNALRDLGVVSRA